jgi:hypothetical protein
LSDFLRTSASEAVIFTFPPVQPATGQTSMRTEPLPLATNVFASGVPTVNSLDA